MCTVAHTIIGRRFALVTLLVLLLWPLAGSAHAQVGQPDLVPTALVAPPSGDVTQSISVTWTVANQGTGQAYPNPTTWADEVFLSTDATYDGADRFVGNVNHTTSLPAGASYTVTQSFTLPIVPDGNYYLLLFTDALNVVPETNETNNVIAVPIVIGSNSIVPVPQPQPPTANATPELDSLTLFGSALLSVVGYGALRRRARRTS